MEIRINARDGLKKPTNLLTTMNNTLYTDLDYHVFQQCLGDQAHPNITGTGFSVHSNRAVRFQGSITDDEAKPYVLKLLEDPETDSRGIQMVLRSDDQIAFWEEIQNQLIHCMWTRAEKWFGRSMELEDAKRTFKPLVVPVDNGKKSIVLRMSRKARVFRYGRGGRTEECSLADVECDMPIVPICDFMGLWIKPDSFGAVVRVAYLLIFPQERVREQVEDNYPGFIMGGDRNYDLHDTSTVFDSAVYRAERQAGNDGEGLRLFEDLDIEGPRAVTISPEALSGSHHASPQHESRSGSRHASPHGSRSGSHHASPPHGSRSGSRSGSHHASQPYGSCSGSHHASPHGAEASASPPVRRRTDPGSHRSRGSN